MLPADEYDRLALERWPDIPWLEPIAITIMGTPLRRGYGCRLCIARQGRRGADAVHSKEEVMTHIAQEHAQALGGTSR